MGDELGLRGALLLGDMIDEDLDGECCNLKMVAPQAKSIDDGKRAIATAEDRAGQREGR
jgi:hypothetical protein